MPSVREEIMRITNVEPIVLSAPLQEPWRIGTAVFSRMTATLVNVYTDEGISGVGECLVRFSPEAAASIVEGILKPLLLGQDPFEVELLWDKMYGVMRGRGHSKGFMVEAISGVDIALWDIVGKALGQPIHRLLGSYGRDRLPIYASSLLFKPTDSLVKEAEDLVSRGFPAIKLKVGQGPDTDLRNVREIRRAVGDGVRIMADANCAFDTLSAMQLGRKLEDEGVYWFEEPIPPENLDGYARLAGALDMAIAGGESEFTRWGFKELMTRAAVDIVQPDVGRVGGFSEARKIAALASAFDVPIAPHTGASSAVSIAASIQWSATLPNLLVFEYMYPPNPLREELLLEPLPTMEAGCIRVPHKPGLGIEIDPVALKRFQI
jgi:L-alanine-DL-glutamate epimerase-like enolase superfamily enzyme